jgi:RHS repeat-associated protein
VASFSTFTGPFGFAGNWGYQSDADSGLQLLGHRYYDPSTGRFLTRDPIKDGRNWYAYCENNPLKAVDPDGLQVFKHKDIHTIEVIFRDAWRKIAIDKIGKWLEGIFKPRKRKSEPTPTPQPGPADSPGDSPKPGAGNTIAVVPPNGERIKIGPGTHVFPPGTTLIGLPAGSEIEVIDGVIIVIIKEE